MRIEWDEEAWEDYVYWQSQDRKTLKKINDLLKDAQRSPFSGKGKPEPLKNRLSGYWSRRINDFDRLVYCVKDDKLVILGCKGHYE